MQPPIPPIRRMVSCGPGKRIPLHHRRWPFLRYPPGSFFHDGFNASAALTPKSAFPYRQAAPSGGVNCLDVFLITFSGACNFWIPIVLVRPGEFCFAAIVAMPVAAMYPDNGPMFAEHYVRLPREVL